MDDVIILWFTGSFSRQFTRNKLAKLVHFKIYFVCWLSTASSAFSPRLHVKGISNLGQELQKGFCIRVTWALKNRPNPVSCKSEMKICNRVTWALRALVTWALLSNRPNLLMLHRPPLGSWHLKALPFGGHFTFYCRYLKWNHSALLGHCEESVLMCTL